MPERMVLCEGSDKPAEPTSRGLGWFCRICGKSAYTYLSGRDGERFIYPHERVSGD